MPCILFGDVPELRRHGFAVSCVVSAETFELAELILVDVDEAVEDLPDGLQVDPVASQELRTGCERGVAKALRCLAVDPNLEPVDAFNDALSEVFCLWQQARPNCHLVVSIDDGVGVDAVGLEPPIVRVEDVGCDFLEAMWHLPGAIGHHADIDFFEVEVRKYSSTYNPDTGDLPQLESLGITVISGADRSCIVRDLRPCCLYKVRVRAVLPGAQHHGSGWSADATARTEGRDGPVAAPRAASGRVPTRHPAAVGPVPQKRCLVPTEHGVAERASASSSARRAQTRPGSAPASRAPRSGGYGGGAGGGRPLVPERPRRAAGRASATLNAAYGEISTEEATRECLHARKCKNWNDFVRLGQHCGRDPGTREKRLQRLRMVVAQAELYDPAYAREGKFAMGPFYTDEHGRRVYETLQEKIRADDRSS